MAVQINRFEARQSVDSDTEVNPSAVSTSKDLVSQSGITSLGDGNGPGQVNQFWSDRRTIAPGGNDDLDLSGVLANWAGQLIALTALKVLVVINRSGDPATILTVGNTGGNFPPTPWQAPCGPGNHFTVQETQAGIAVVAGTGDTLRITNNDGVNQASYDIYIAGVE